MIAIASHMVASFMANRRRISLAPPSTGFQRIDLAEDS
jgi:hypothetical protein